MPYSRNYRPPEEITFFVSETHRYREADVVATLLTWERGRIVATARSVMRSRKRFPAGLEPYTEYSGLIRRAGDRWELLEAVPAGRYAPAGPSLSFTVKGACATWIVSRFLQEDQPDPDLMDKLKSFFAFASQGRILLGAFVLSVLRHAGFSPSIRECVECGRTPVQEGWLYSPRKGGVVCPDHGTAEGFVLSGTDCTWLMGKKDSEPSCGLVTALVATVEHVAERPAPCRRLLSTLPGCKDGGP